MSCCGGKQQTTTCFLGGTSAGPLPKTRRPRPARTRSPERPWPAQRKGALRPAPRERLRRAPVPPPMARHKPQGHPPRHPPTPAASWGGLASPPMVPAANPAARPSLCDPRHIGVLGTPLHVTPSQRRAKRRVGWGGSLCDVDAGGSRDGYLLNHRHLVLSMTQDRREVDAFAGEAARGSSSSGGGVVLATSLGHDVLQALSRSFDMGVDLRRTARGTGHAHSWCSFRVIRSCAADGIIVPHPPYGSERLLRYHSIAGVPFDRGATILHGCRLRQHALSSP